MGPLGSKCVPRIWDLIDVLPPLVKAAGILDLAFLHDCIAIGCGLELWLGSLQFLLHPIRTLDTRISVVPFHSDGLSQVFYNTQLWAVLTLVSPLRCLPNALCHHFKILSRRWPTYPAQEEWQQWAHTHSSRWHGGGKCIKLAVRCYRKPWMNFLANPVVCSTHRRWCSHSGKLEE